MNRLINIIILSFLINQPIFAIGERENLDYIVAVVNDDVIVNTILQQELRFIIKDWQSKNRRIPLRQDLEKQALEHLIMSTLQLQLAKRQGIQVEDSTLNERLRQIAAQNQMDLYRFRNTIEAEGYRFVPFRERIRQKMITKRLQQRQVISRINITEREIDNFLANQIKQGTVSNEYHIWHILIATSEAPSPEEIKTKQQKTKEVLIKLNKGADFQATAVAVSEARQALEGGDLGWLKMGEMPSLFENVINSMAIGEIQGPLRDISGFHIIKLVDKRGDKSIVTQTKVRHILIKPNELISELEAKSRLNELKYRIEQGHDFVELARVIQAVLPMVVYWVGLIRGN